MKPLRLLFAAAMLAITVACAVPVAPRDFNTTAADVLQTADAAVTTARTLLRAGKLQPDDAESVLKAASLARDGVAIARSTKVTQGDAAGTDRLRLAANSLDQLNAYLATKGK